MDFSRPLGPGLLARQHCRPGERLLWATRGQVFYYDVDGLDPLGQPRKNALVRGVGAVGRGVGGFVLTGIGEVLLGGGNDSSSDKPPEADHLIFGPRPGCLAEATVARLGVAPGKRVGRLWMLTSTRLAVLGPRPAPEPPPEPEPAPQTRSLLGKATGLGKGLLDVGRDIAKIVADTRRSYGAHVEGEPVPVPDLVPLAEIPRQRIAAVHAVDRKREPCLRVSLVDGSGVDFRLADPELAARVVELTNGTR
ncbi:hypothetical protein [Crossiella sp. NPDC003009]